MVSSGFVLSKMKIEVAEGLTGRVWHLLFVYFCRNSEIYSLESRIARGC